MCARACIYMCVRVCVCGSVCMLAWDCVIVCMTLANEHARLVLRRTSNEMSVNIYMCVNVGAKNDRLLFNTYVHAHPRV